MANNNVPAHDFAPAWLKIPSYDSAKKNSPEEPGAHTSRKDEPRLGFSRWSRDSDSLSGRQQPYGEGNRDHDGHSGERRNPYFLSRHHSIDVDDSQHFLSGPQLFNDNNAFLSGSQPSLLRRPHSRHDFRDFLQPSYHKNSSQHSLKPKGKSPSPPTSSNKSTAETEKKDLSSNNFNQEFPSLQGNISENDSPTLPVINGSVWENPRNAKVHGTSTLKKIQLIQRPLRNDLNLDSRSKSPASSGGSTGSVCTSVAAASSGGSAVAAVAAAPAVASPKVNPHTTITSQCSKQSNQNASSIYRALVPTKSTNLKRSSRDLLKLPGAKEPITNGLGFTNALSPTTANSSSATSSFANKTKLSSAQPSHTMEILVKNPKTRGNKSDFLKALRSGEDSKGEETKNDSKDGEPNTEGRNLDQGSEHKYHEDEKFVNGVDIAKMSLDDCCENPPLSSSLEAEQRLLKEMGWKEETSDDDAYAPLTEDELKEFQNLTKLRQEKKNGIRNVQPFVWSPSRTVQQLASVVPPVDNNWSSSSDSDWDSD